MFRDWTIKIMVRNAEDNTIRGSYRPMRSANIIIAVLRLFDSMSAKQSCGSGFIESGFPDPAFQVNSDPNPIQI